MPETWDVEVTDTFGGEANYAWVDRYRITVPSGATQRTIMRAAKREAGYSGERGRTDSFGDMFAFYPRGAHVVMFVTFAE